MIRRLPAWGLLAPLTLLLALGACRRDEASAPVSAPGNPVDAVKAQADALRANDLLRFRQLSLPADLLARSRALWDARVARAGPVDPADAREYDEMMSRLLAPDAEQALMRDLEPKLAQFETEAAGQWPLVQATLGIFLNAAVQANERLTPAEKDHGAEVVASLLAWAQPALFTDRARARRAIEAAVRTARELQLPTLADARALGHDAALAKGGVAFDGAKAIARAYGLDLDAALDGLQAELVSTEGDAATVKVSYPFLGKTVAFEQRMVRRGDGWYSADALAQAEAELAEGEAELAAATPASDADADTDADLDADAPAAESADTPAATH